MLACKFINIIDFGQKEFKWKNHQKWWFCNPSTTYQSLLEKLFGPMSLDEKNMRGDKITKVPIILEEKLFDGRLILYQKLRRKYPPKSLFLMVDHQKTMISLALPKWYTYWRYLIIFFCSEWAYGCILTLLLPQMLDQILVSRPNASVGIGYERHHTTSWLRLQTLQNGSQFHLIHILKCDLTTFFAVDMCMVSS